MNTENCLKIFSRLQATPSWTHMRSFDIPTHKGSPQITVFRRSYITCVTRASISTARIMTATVDAREVQRRLSPKNLGSIPNLSRPSKLTNLLVPSSQKCQAATCLLLKINVHRPILHICMHYKLSNGDISWGIRVPRAPGHEPRWGLRSGDCIPEAENQLDKRVLIMLLCTFCYRMHVVMGLDLFIYWKNQIYSL